MDLASSESIRPNICWPRQIAAHFPERRCTAGMAMLMGLRSRDRAHVKSIDVEALIG